MRKVKLDYQKAEYGIVALLSVVMLAIPVTHYICLCNVWPNSVLANVIYLTVILCIAGGVVLCRMSNAKFNMGRYEYVLIILLIFEMLSVSYSINRELSIWGDVGRNEGFLMLCSYYALFCVSRMLESDKAKALVVNIFLGITLLHSAYGLCQYFDVATGVVIDKYNMMISGVAGNPNFMGTLLVMASGLAAGMFYYSEKLYQKLAYLGILAVYLFTTLLTKTMSAYLGVAVMALAFLAYVTITRNKHRQFEGQKITSFIILMVALFGGVAALFLINAAMGNFIVKELSELVHQMTQMMETGQINESFGTGRFTIWANVLKLVPKYLFTGVGIDVLSKIYHNKFGRVNGQIVDKCHNEYLQVLITTGLPALLCYLALYYFIAKDLFKRLKEIVSHEREWNGEPLYAGLTLAFIGYLAQAFFNISVIDVAPYFWILLGLMTASPMQVKKRGEAVSNQNKHITLVNKRKK